MFTETLFLRRKDKKHQNLGCEFIRNDTSKRYDKDYEIGRMQTFIGQFKDRQIK